MENFNPLRVIAKYWWLILGITLVVFAAAWYSYSKKPANYFGSVAVTVQGSKVYPKTEQLILQSDSSGDSQVLVATTQAWLADPSYVKTILDKAGIPIDDPSLKGLSKVFKVVLPVENSTSYSVQFTGKDENQTRRAFAEMRTLMDQVKDQYNQKETGLTANLIYSDPIITKTGSDLPLMPIAGLLVGFIFAVVVASVLERARA